MKKLAFDFVVIIQLDCFPIMIKDKLTTDKF